MKKSIIAALVALTTIAAPAVSMAKAPTSKQVATEFVNGVIKSADGDGDGTHTVGITCPVKGTTINPFIGQILITGSSWGINEGRGVLVMEKPVDQPPGGLDVIIPNIDDEHAADYFSDDSPAKYARGLDFQFMQPGGEFFITVLKDGRATVSVSAHGKKATKPFPCKVIPADEVNL